MGRLLDRLFCDWVVKKSGTLEEVLEARSELVRD
jgi:hypothetical protein